MRRPKVTVLIPARDEADTVGQVVTAAREAFARRETPVEVLVIDDGSTDATAELARAAGARVIPGSSRGGYGAAVKRGVLAASGELVCLIDADGTYPAEALPDLVAAVEAGADQAVGARPRAGAGGSRLRAWVKGVIHALARLAAGAAVVDLNSGIRCCRRELALSLLPLLPNGFSLTTTLTTAALLEGWWIRWLPVGYSPRHGSSRFRPVRDTLRLLLALVRSVAYFAPLRLFLPAASATGLTALAFLLWDILVERNLTDKTVLAALTTVEVLLLGFLADLVARSARRHHSGS